MSAMMFKLTTGEKIYVYVWTVYFYIELWPGKNISTF